MKRHDTLGYYEDPLERRIFDALTDAGIPFVQENDPRAECLDFFLPEQGVHIEVKAYHAERISKQMARVPFCIAVQGDKAVEWLASLISPAAPSRFEPTQKKPGEFVLTGDGRLVRCE